MSFKQLLESYKNAKPSDEAEPAKKKAKYEGPLLQKLTAIHKTECERISTNVNESEIRCDGPFTGLGLLFIIIDDLPHEAIWRLWIEQWEQHQLNSTHTTEPGGETEHASSSSSCNSGSRDSIMPGQQVAPKIRVWIHAKHPNKVNSPWVRERLVQSFHLTPGWGSVELTDVMIRMLGEAMSAAPEISKFCFASETCIPVLPLAAVLKSISGPGFDSDIKSGALPNHDDDSKVNLNTDECSWVNYQHTANNGYAQQLQFDVLRDELPVGCTVEADQWVMLSRPHAQAVLDLSSRVGSKVLNIFRRVRASDEMYFPSCLAVLGLIPSPTTEINHGNNRSNSGESKTSATNESTNVTGSSATATSNDSTAAAASGPVHAGVVVKRQLTYCVWGHSAKSPVTFETITAKDIAAARRNGSVFMRKIVVPVSSSSSSSSSSVSGTAASSSSSVAVSDKFSLLAPEKLQFVRLWLDLVLDTRDSVVNDASVTAESSGVAGVDNVESCQGDDKIGAGAMPFSVSYCIQRVGDYQKERKDDEIRRLEEQRRREQLRLQENEQDIGRDGSRSGRNTDNYRHNSNDRNSERNRGAAGGDDRGRSRSRDRNRDSGRSGSYNEGYTNDSYGGTYNGTSYGDTYGGSYGGSNERSYCGSYGTDSYRSSNEQYRSASGYHGSDRGSRDTRYGDRGYQRDDSRNRNPSRQYGGRGSNDSRGYYGGGRGQGRGEGGGGGGGGYYR